MPVALPPCEQVTLQPTSAIDARDLGGALLDEREQVGVGDFLLGVGQGDRLAVDGVERLALEVVAELAELALQARAGRTACRWSAGCRPARPTAGS